MEVLSGPVDVCVDRRSLSLDRPFTYELAAELEAGVGSLVEVPFHGRRVRGWVLGPSDDVPARLLPVSARVSPVRFFDERDLGLFRWVSERYIASLATVIAGSHPPRVVSEENRPTEPVPGGPMERPQAFGPSPLLEGYRNGSRLLQSLSGQGGGFVLRPAPLDEQAVAVESVTHCLASGRRAIVLVPEVDPLPATAAAVLEAVGERGTLYAGAAKRDRYRHWLDIGEGRYDVVVGTRASVFLPVERIGLIFVSRESHALHREERAPYFHVRDIATERARRHGATAVLSAFCPSIEAASSGLPEVVAQRRAWPPVEVVTPGPEGRAPRLATALKGTHGAFLFQSLRGYGVARACRSCGEPAACPDCGGSIRSERGALSCVVCGAPGRCPSCGSQDLGIQRGGVERVREWASRISVLPAASPPPRSGALVVGGAEAVKDIAPPGLDLVAVLDADLAARRPGLASAEHALALWMEAAAWAAPAGRVIVPTKERNAPAIQALVQGNPTRFHRAETVRRVEAGFPPGFPVFRVRGTSALPEALRQVSPVNLLETLDAGDALCLVTVSPDGLPGFGRHVRELAQRGIVSRVEAEPHL